MESYPEYWEADVVLRDGATAHLRPIVPSDAEAIQEMHSKQSPESIYLRFFAPLPAIPKRDLDRFVHVDYHDRVAFVMTIGDEIIGIARYDRLDERSAEVAFNIADAHQGRGLGSIFLEHLAAAARERGISVFTAEVLPQNRSMLQVFAAAGYEVSREFDDGVVAVRFDIDPTEKSIQVQEAREHRAEALSVRQALSPRSVVVIGASRKKNSTGNLLLRNLTTAGFNGRIHVVHPEAEAVVGIPAVKALDEIGRPVDLAIIAVPAEAVSDVVRDCAAHGVKAVVVISSGFAETGEHGLELQRTMVATARSHGMRVVGPNSFGLANTAEDVSLNASLAPFLPDPGALGLFSQSGALGTALLAAAKTRGLGISTFVSAGNRADLSGNDVLQYWEEDPATSVVGLYFESIGNPRKFSRIARRVSRVKPVIVIKSDFTGRELPPGHTVRLSSLSGKALDQVLTQAGVIRADTIHQLFDIAQVFTSQPLPGGRRVGVIGNSAALSTLVVQRARAAGLRVDAPPVSLHPEVSAEEFGAALTEVYEDPTVDSVVVIFTPSAGAEEAEVARIVATEAARSGRTTVACFLGVHGVKDALTAHTIDEDGNRTAHAVPSFMGPEDAVWALSHATEYAMWRKSDRGTYPEFDAIDERGARAIIERNLSGVEAGRRVSLSREDANALLECYGVSGVPYLASHSVEEAKAAAEELGYPVALKAVSTRLRHRLELGGVRLNIDDPEELEEDWNGIRRVIEAVLGPDDDHGIDVQPMAPPGTSCVIRAGEDPLLGPMVSFSLAGDTSELLDDVAHRVAPLTDVDARQMVRGLRSSPRLFGYKGLPVMNVAPIEDILLRLSTLVDDFPAIREVEIRPVMVTETDAHVLSIKVELVAASDRMDSFRRRLFIG
ncbi:GNAT family N-acetyltransferase [Brevibacterium samyangense]|uniref:Bifunctional GNAT family N-acetyltransferase/acetate--CoA ligase family protein n=1 Tax=Brevibacterium samyangense TaxID=366888 RepID=A0ABN2TFQ4_9MICO